MSDNYDLCYKSTNELEAAGLAIANVGTAAAGGTSITVNVQYVLVDAA